MVPFLSDVREKVGGERMTREEARVLLKTLNNRVTSAFYDGDFWVEEGTFEAFEVADAALRGPQPDPDTGLMPCGCGGKAHIINSSGYSRRLYVECDRCDIMLGVEATGDGALQGIYRYDDQIIKDWNRAMGYREEEGHD